MSSQNASVFYQNELSLCRNSLGVGWHRWYGHEVLPSSFKAASLHVFGTRYKTVWRYIPTFPATRSSHRITCSASLDGRLVEIIRHRTNSTVVTRSTLLCQIALKYFNGQGCVLRYENYLASGSENICALCNLISLKQALPTATNHCKTLHISPPFNTNWRESLLSCPPSRHFPMPGH